MQLNNKSLREWFAIPAILLLMISCKNDREQYDDIPEQKEQVAENKEPTKAELVDRGEYLVNIMGCRDCHSPKRMGERGPEYVEELAFSGFQAGNELPPISTDALEKGWMLMFPDLTAAVGPWGVSFAANLTSHETGIGTWNFDQFKRALTEGKLKGLPNGRTLLPPMPWENLKNMTDEDLRAMYEYFQSTAPVENNVPAPISPEKFSSM